MLKPYNANPDDFNYEILPSPKIISEINKEEYDVETILDKKFVYHKLFYLIK